MTIYLNIGSNQGDRRSLIEKAVALIASAYPAGRMRRSDFIESEPWGFDSPNPFLNLGLAIELDDEREPLEILDDIEAIQSEICDESHRNPDGSYRDRKIDIDIIAIDQIILDHPRLILPHPRAHLRPFVMIPMRQIAPASLYSWLLSRQ